MAITTLSGASAGLINSFFFQKLSGTPEALGVMHSLFYAGSMPAAATAPSPGLAGAALTTYAGQIPFQNPTSGNTYLGTFWFSGLSTQSLILVDRLWHNSGFTVTTTTAQTVNSATWPSRCVPSSGDTPDTNGGNIMVGIEVSTATTNAGAITNMTMSYTNDAGTAGRTATISSFPATAAVGTFVAFGLAAGDTGVRSIQSLTLGTSLVTGVVHLVAYRPLARIGILYAGDSAYLDPITSGFPMLYNDSVPFLIMGTATVASTQLLGEIAFTQG